MNFYGSARSNFFKVKDPEGFEAWALERALVVLESRLNPGSYAVFPNPDKGEDGCWPTSVTLIPPEGLDEDARYDWLEAAGADEMEQVEIDVPSALAEQLAEGEIAVLMQAGSEGLRYVSGHATAVAWDGREVDIDLVDIYKLAATTFGVLPGSINSAEAE